LKTKLLHIALGNHNKGLWKSFDKHFDTIHYDWKPNRLDPTLINKEILEIFRRFKPKAVFMQLQSDGILSLETAKEMTKSAFTMNWSGDVRTPLPKWFYTLGKEIDITLFSNVTDVKILKHSNINSDYLQVGFDPQIFNPFNKSEKQFGKILFMGSNYENRFPLSIYRLNMGEFMQSTYGSDFQIYGMNWKSVTNKESTLLDVQDEAIAYSNCDIAINLSHFDYERYSSDRLLRMMGSGAFCLSHNFKSIENDFELNKHLVTWNNLTDLKDKIDYYWANKYERQKIALEGCRYVRENCTWDKRMEEMKKIINLK
tara:strand:- start:284 stop:1225 length:942 start_codon:yes stop_codon:yes gene_type:complete